MTAKLMKMTVQVIKQVNGLRRLELLARIPAVALRLTTAIKILAKVRNMRYANNI